MCAIVGAVAHNVRLKTQEGSPMPVLYWLSGLSLFIAVTRVLPIKALKPLFLQNPQPRTFLFWLAVAVALAVAGYLLRTESKEPAYRR